jgi:hypothetical protein
VHRPHRREGLKHHQIERALEDFGSGRRHRLSCGLLREAYRNFCGM